MAQADAKEPRWLMLLHAIPPRPAYLRVKIWRRLQQIGAVAVKNAAYVLPQSEAAHEDLRWIQREIEAGGGEATLVEARFVDGLDDGQVKALFDAARQADYARIEEDARALAGASGDPGEREAALRRLRRRFEQVAAIDFFGAPGRKAAESRLGALDARLRPRSAASPEPRAAAPRGRVWVTRRGVHIDRIASAWLIRRFLDAKARFKFVAERGYAPKRGELRFDMFDAEFTHEGDKCTFEVLCGRFMPGDKALAEIAEIVHDIDMKDGKFGREEAAGLGAVIEGLVRSVSGDDARLARGAELFGALYENLKAKKR